MSGTTESLTVLSNHFSETFAADNGFELEPRRQSERDSDVAAFADSVLWPLFHGFSEYCDFRPELWKAYLEDNRRAALDLARSPTAGTQIWIDDYQLMHVGQMLRAAKVDLQRLGFFLHIPFPDVEVLRRMPWSQQIVGALLAYDLIGFQSPQDLHNFVKSVEYFKPSCRIERTRRGVRIRVGHRELRAETFPFGTDFKSFSERARQPQTATRVADLQRNLGPYDVLLGVDRLDYTQGLLHRLDALEAALERYPSLREQVVLYQLVEPSGHPTGAYAELKDELERTVGRICGKFSTRKWTPIRYRYTRVDEHELAALYRLAKVALVTPLRDGMNLVSKEYVASQVDCSGVLVLSEFAGAAAQLADGAILTNPYDVDASAAAIHQAVQLPADERRRRMTSLRQSVEATDVGWWAERFMARLERPIEAGKAAEPAWRARSAETLPLRTS